VTPKWGMYNTNVQFFLLNKCGMNIQEDTRYLCFFFYYLTYVLKSILDSFFFSIVKVLLKIQKSNQKTVGISTYSSDKKGTSVMRFWLSFYADAYSFPFFSPFFDLLLKHAPDPHFLILEPTRLPNKIFLVSCIFSIILIPIAISFWITPLIW
jgi:hypothetical protein